MALSPLEGMTPSPKAKAQILSRVYSPTSSSPSVVKLAKLIQKIRHRTSILFISSFEKAAYKYFNYFGPWTADVHGPLLNSCVMNVIMTVAKARPVKNRAVPPCGAGVLACGLGRRPAATAMKPTALLAQSPAPRDQSLPDGFNFKFRVLFHSPPGFAQPKIRKLLKSKWLTN
jgi:hypothetical protein